MATAEVTAGEPIWQIQDNCQRPDACPLRDPCPWMWTRLGEPS